MALRTASPGPSPGTRTPRPRTASSVATARASMPLAHALDATLSLLLDERISQFEGLFRTMEGRLHKLEGHLETMTAKVEQEATGRVTVDEDFTKRLHAIQEKLLTKVDLEELNEMEVRMRQTEAQIQKELKNKLKQVLMMHEVLGHFEKLGQSVGKAKASAKFDAEQMLSATTAAAEEVQAEDAVSVSGSSDVGGSSPVSTANFDAGMQEVHRHLESLNLAHYASIFNEQGYDHLPTLREMSTGELDAMKAQTGMKNGHFISLKNSLAFDR